jgi:hypothetical protein
MSNPHVEKALASMRNNKSALARELGVTQPFIYKLLNAQVVPARHCQVISRLSGDPLHVINPDIYPAPTEHNRAA